MVQNATYEGDFMQNDDIGDDDDDDDDDYDNDDDDDCRTGQSGWVDGNTQCKSEGDAQLATIK